MPQGIGFHGEDIRVGAAAGEARLGELQLGPAPHRIFGWLSHRAISRQIAISSDHDSLGSASAASGSCGLMVALLNRCPSCTGMLRTFVQESTRRPEAEAPHGAAGVHFG